jgi:glycosyltransferase involved in cell wall biosynthesis
MFEQKLMHVVSGLRPGGGPAGYLYNLSQFLRASGCGGSHISIYPYKQDTRNGFGARIFRELKRLGGSFASEDKLEREVRRWKGVDPPVSMEKSQCIRSMRAVVSHNILFSIFYLRNQRPEGQKFYIFNHSPVDSAVETLEDWKLKFGRLPGSEDVLRLELAETEMAAYEAADGVIAPCREAVEAYFIWDNRLRSRFENVLNTKHLYEIPTGVPELTPSSQWQARKKEMFGNKMVIGYFGRYHQHKGFDLFCELASLAEGDTHFRFISAGKAFMNAPAGRTNYTDLGALDKQTELPDFMRMCDLVVIPNRHTYFDLVALEAMSMGRAILTSATGGHRYLARQSSGILTCEPLNSSRLYAILRGYSPTELTAYGDENRRVYEKEYTVERFASRHIDLARRLLTDGI